MIYVSMLFIVVISVMFQAAHSARSLLKKRMLNMAPINKNTIFTLHIETKASCKHVYSEC